MSTIFPIEFSYDTKTHTPVDLSCLKKEIRENFCDAEEIDLTFYEINRAYDRSIKNFNELNGNRYYGVLLDILNKQIERYHNYHIELWKKDSRPKHIIAAVRTMSFDWDNHLSKLRQLIISNFEALNEIREFSRAKSFAKYFVWTFEMNDPQIMLINKLVEFGRIQLKTAYTHNYSILPPEKSILENIKKIEDDYFNQTL